MGGLEALNFIGGGSGQLLGVSTSGLFLWEGTLPRDRPAHLLSGNRSLAAHVQGTNLGKAQNPCIYVFPVSSLLSLWYIDSQESRPGRVQPSLANQSPGHHQINGKTFQRKWERSSKNLFFISLDLLQQQTASLPVP